MLGSCLSGLAAFDMRVSRGTTHEGVSREAGLCIVFGQFENSDTTGSSKRLHVRCQRRPEAKTHTFRTLNLSKREA